MWAGVGPVTCGADVAGVAQPSFVQMWAGGGPSPGADVAACERSPGAGGRREPSPGADVGGFSFSVRRSCWRTARRSSTIAARPSSGTAAAARSATAGARPPRGARRGSAATRHRERGCFERGWMEGRVRKAGPGYSGYSDPDRRVPLHEAALPTAWGRCVAQGAAHKAQGYSGYPIKRRGGFPTAT